MSLGFGILPNMKLADTFGTIFALEVVKEFSYSYKKNWIYESQIWISTYRYR